MYQFKKGDKVQHSSGYVAEFECYCSPLPGIKVRIPYFSEDDEYGYAIWFVENCKPVSTKLNKLFIQSVDYDIGIVD